MTDPDHLLVLVHGIHGGVSTFATLIEMLHALHGHRLLCHAVACNEGGLFMNPTHDGVLNGSARSQNEIRSVIGAHPSLRCISFLGHSFGGLYCRHLMGALLDVDRETICGLTPVNFIVTSSPQLGMRIALKATTRMLSRILLGRTGKELLLEDDATGPVVQRLSEPGSTFMRGLALFEWRSAYANRVGDIVPHITASLGSVDSGPGECFDRTAHPHIVNIRKLAPRSNEALAVRADSLEASVAAHLRSLEWRIVTMSFAEELSTHNTLYLHPAGRDVLAEITSSFQLSKSASAESSAPPALTGDIAVGLSSALPS